MTMGKTLSVLNQMVEDGIIQTYVIAGAVAALQYIEPTVTEDLDILITFQSQSPSGLVILGNIVPYLAKQGYAEWKHEGLLIEGWPVQFLPAADPLDLEALEGAEEIVDDFDTGGPIQTRVLSAHHAVAMAIRTGRYKDHARVLAFLDQDAVNLDALRDVILRHSLSEKWHSFLKQTGRPAPFEIDFRA